MKNTQRYTPGGDHKSFATLQEAEYYIYTLDCLMDNRLPIDLGEWLLSNYKMTPINGEAE